MHSDTGLNFSKCKAEVKSCLLIMLAEAMIAIKADEITDLENLLILLLIMLYCLLSCFLFLRLLKIAVYLGFSYSCCWCCSPFVHKLLTVECILFTSWGIRSEHISLVNGMLLVCSYL